MSVNYNPATPTNGLILCLDSRNPRSYPDSGTTWFDISGNNNNGTLVNGPVFTSNGFSFDGVNDYISTSISLTGQFSVSMWFNRRTSGTDDGRIIYGNISDADTYLAWIRSSSVVVQGDTTASLKTFLGFTFSNNQWYNIVIIRNISNEVKVFINSIESTSGSQVISATFTLNAIGRYFNATGGNAPYQWDGLIDNIRIYNRSISATEVQQLFQAQRGRYGI